MVDGVRHTMRADKTPPPKTTGIRKPNPREIGRAWRERTGPDTMPVQARPDTSCAPVPPRSSFLDTAYGLSYVMETVADVANQFAPKVQKKKQTNPITDFFSSFVNTNTKYNQAVDLKKVDPKAAEATTQTVKGFLATNKPTEVGDAETFANNLIYSMNPKGDGKTVTADQAMKYIEGLNADYQTEAGHEVLKSMIDELKDKDGNISCEKLKSAFMAAVKDGKTDTNSFNMALTNEGLKKAMVGKDGKSYILQMTKNGIKAYLEKDGKIGEEVPFDQSNFME